MVDGGWWMMGGDGKLISKGLRRSRGTHARKRHLRFRIITSVTSEYTLE